MVHFSQRGAFFDLGEGLAKLAIYVDLYHLLESCLKQKVINKNLVAPILEPHSLSIDLLNKATNIYM